MKNKLVCILVASLFLTAVSAVTAQSPIRVKCGNFTMNVPSANVSCYQVEANIPLDETASPEMVANAQVANFAFYFSDFASLQSRIAPQVTFYLIEDLGRTSFDLLDLGLNMSDIMNSINAEYGTAGDYYESLPFLPYQTSEKTANGLPLQLNFEGGAGIRTIVSFDSSISAVSGNSNLYYSFQGISPDGKYYVSAVFPLRSAVLNGRQADEINWSDLDSSDFQPSLDELDYYIRSIVIE